MYVYLLKDWIKLSKITVDMILALIYNTYMEQQIQSDSL